MADLAELTLRFTGDTSDMDRAFDHATRQAEAFRSRMASITDFRLDANVSAFSEAMNRATSDSRQMADTVTDHFRRVREDAARGATFRLRVSGLPQSLAAVDALEARLRAFHGEAERLGNVKLDADTAAFDRDLASSTGQAERFDIQTRRHFENVRSDAARGATYQVREVGTPEVTQRLNELLSRGSEITRSPVIVVTQEAGVTETTSRLAFLHGWMDRIRRDKVSVAVDQASSEQTRTLGDRVRTLGETLRSVSIIGQAFSMAALTAVVGGAIPLVSALSVGAIGLASALGTGLAGAVGTAAASMVLGMGSIMGYVAGTKALVSSSLDAVTN
ncbi:MAG: hypothetical protein M3P49_13170, partial [Actinomycetota bacterium]|nr:hypothetical protein [Actinomycetota bacterium]